MTATHLNVGSISTSSCPTITPMRAAPPRRQGTPSCSYLRQSRKAGSAKCWNWRMARYSSWTGSSRGGNVNIIPLLPSCSSSSTSSRLMMRFQRIRRERARLPRLRRLCLRHRKSERWPAGESLRRSILGKRRLWVGVSLGLRWRWWIWGR